jgi:flagellar biosynthesis protein FlhF
MRIQRYIARDMRQALAQVREALGPDAVILSSGRVGSDVEVVAAIDTEVAQAVASAPPARSYAALAGEVSATAASAPPAVMRHAELLRNRRSSTQISESLAPTIATAQASAPAAAPAKAAPTAASIVAPDQNAPGQQALANEMKDMRRMLEAQLATLAWNDLSRRSPTQAAMQKELAQIGITQDLANSLVRKIPRELSFSAARRFALATIARTLRVTGDRWLEKGGVVAFAGPAGAGKTTLLAKLAARWVLRHGTRRVAIVSADAVRIGAHEQMHMLGRLLGVTTHNVYDVSELPELLYELRGCQFIMIDTAGVSPRDPELARRLRLLHQMQASIETALVLPASTQAGAIDEVVQRFELARPTACVLTKVDEAVSCPRWFATSCRSPT